MQHERFDAYIQKERRKIALTGASSTAIQSGPLPSPWAMLSILVSPAPPHSISEQKGRWQLTAATGDPGDEEKTRRERRGKQGDLTVSSVKIN